uniref:OTU domain-containing protein n=1 Tax=Gossypium raimondii TaxID=29730 RepID=A0A0D2QKQ0_GOSRA|nr:hypothetical protein B456_003G143700 [Gossypium raimondii]
MVTSEQEHDFVKWGLQLFNSDPYANCGYCGVLTQENGEYYTGNSFKEDDHYDAGECCNVENDEAIAHTLQLQELSKLAVVGSPSQGEEEELQLQVSGYTRDCINQSVGDFGSGQGCGEEEQDEITTSSSCSSPEEKLLCEEDRSYSLELTDEFALDGEVGKRLNQMVPVPHIPRINGEIPSVDEATLDHQRLLERLQVYNLVELKVEGDGNCQAAADSYGVKIFVITSFKDTCYIEILPNVQKSKRVIFLSFWAEVHYNSIYPVGDVPSFGMKKKKRWRMLRNKHLESTDGYQ